MTNPFRTTPGPAKIFAEQAGLNLVSLSIHTLERVTAIEIHPEEAYSIARYLEWLVEPGVCPEPNNHCPSGTGVWGENTEHGRVVHVVIVADDDEEGYGSVIALDISRAAILSNQLISLAVDATPMEDPRVQ